MHQFTWVEKRSRSVCVTQPIKKLPIKKLVWRNQCGKLLLSPSPGVSVNWEARKLGAKMKRGKLCGEHIWRPRGFLLYRKDRGGLVGQLCKTLHESCKWKVKRANAKFARFSQFFPPKANLCHVSSKKSHVCVKENIIISITTTMVSSVTSQFFPFKFFQ